MKNNMKLPHLSLKLISHRIIRIKSNAFLKLVLHAEATDDESSSSSNQQ
jgi:hypothetical protein